MCCSTSLYTLICRYAPSWSSDAARTPLEFTPTKIINTRATETASKTIFELLGIGRNLLQSARAYLLAQRNAQFRLDAAPRNPGSAPPQSRQSRDCLNHTLESRGNESSARSAWRRWTESNGTYFPWILALSA